MKNRTIHVVSEKGLYDLWFYGENIFLENDVTLTTTNGYVVKAPSTIDLKTKNLSGAHRIEGNGPQGSLVASKISIRDH